MANKYIKYIVALLCLCCAVNVHAQTDSSAAVQDSVVVDSSIVSGNHNDNYGSSSGENEGAALDKFSKKTPGDEMHRVTDRRLNQGKIQEMKKDKDFWYADKPVNKPKEEAKIKKTFWDRVFDAIASANWHVVFWFIVIGTFTLIVVAYLRTFTTSARKIRGPAADIPQEEENIFVTNFDDQVNKALSSHNYRLATRLLFLRVLRSMSEKSIISYVHDKTNMDYLFELGNSKYAKDFMQASRVYEYVWYGNFTLQQTQFLQIRHVLDDLNQKITN